MSEIWTAKTVIENRRSLGRDDISPIPSPVILWHLAATVFLGERHI
jgi:hypothetical protein